MYNGSLMLLKFKSKDAWQIIGGMRTTRFEVDNALIDSSNISSGAWQELVSNGLKKINIEATGLFSNSIAEKEICNLAFTGELAEYKLEFADNLNLEGRFFLKDYIRFGDVDEEEAYSIRLLSSGEIKYR